MAGMAMTVKETAKELGLSESTIYEMCYIGTLPHTRVRAKGKKGKGKILISRSLIEEWLRGGEVVNG